MKMEVLSSSDKVQAFIYLITITGTSKFSLFGEIASDALVIVNELL